MADILTGRRKRGNKIAPRHIQKLHQIAKAGMDQGLDVESASVDNYGGDGSPTMSVRFRSGGRKKRSESAAMKMPMPPRNLDGDPDGD